MQAKKQDFEYLEYLFRCFNDPLPKSADVIYLYAETRDNQNSTIKKAAKLYKNNRIKIALCAGGKVSGYLGFNKCKSLLIKEGVRSSDIIAVPCPYSSINTYSESFELNKLAKAKHWHSIIVSAPPFHTPRAFITAISEAVHQKSKVKIYSLPGEPLNWNKKAVHNQGIFTAKRSEFVKTETERIEKYTAKGDLLPIKKILNYLKNRD